MELVPGIRGNKFWLFKNMLISFVQTARCCNWNTQLAASFVSEQHKSYWRTGHANFVVIMFHYPELQLFSFTSKGEHRTHKWLSHELSPIKKLETLLCCGGGDGYMM
jgi:hypothetical protein